MLKERMLRRKNKRRQEILGIKPESPPTSRLLQVPNTVNQPCQPASEGRSRDRMEMAPFQNQRRSEESDAKFELGSSKINEFVKFHDMKSNGSEKQTKSHESDKGSKSREGQDGNVDDEAIVDIELIFCHHCQKSYAPATYKKFCQTLDENGVPKCVSMRNKKRKIYNSAKVRIIFESPTNTCCVSSVNLTQ